MQPRRHEGHQGHEGIQSSLMSGYGILITLLAFTVCGCKPAPTQQLATGVRLQLFADGLKSPLYVTAPVGDSRVFIVEQPGHIRIVKEGNLRTRPFLDITDRVKSGGERGLLSVAFHPDYAVNGFFYVNYTDLRGDTHVERYSVTRDADVADPGSGKLILKVEQPFANHNGGHIQFGPDGMLYIAMGDGGSGGDPQGNGQNRSTLLGDLLRIDVDHGDPYAIPPDNPFVKEKEMRGEIWAWGLRNPWRFAFDRAAGLIYIADVGQNKYEEIDVTDATRGGLNYGWNVMEGRHCYNAAVCLSDGMVLPVLEYGHREGCSVIGGYVYRGAAIPGITGSYFYADYCLGWIRSFKFVDGKATEAKVWKLGVEGNVLSFGEDAAHELYVLYANGKVYKFMP